MKRVRLKRVYAPAEPEDGARVLVDRLWPRGMSKERARLTAWVKDAAPSHDLRRWFDHDPDRWEQFKRRYFAELQEAPDAVQELVDLAQRGTLTLLHASRDEKRNNAVALREHLLERGGVDQLGPE